VGSDKTNINKAYGGQTARFDHYF